MGTFKVQCPSCNQTLEADEAWEGMELPCPKCKSCFKIKNVQSSLDPDLEIVADSPRTTMENEAKQNISSSCQGEEANQHLLEAAIYGDFKTVQFLVEKCHANINYRDQYGYTPLLWSCITGKMFHRNYIPSEEIERQLEYLNTTPETKLPIVTYLLEKNADIKAKTNIFTDEKRLGILQAGGASVLHLADDPAIVKLLITHGAELEEKDAQGNTPLHIADEHKTEILLKNGANSKSIGSQGNTPLHYAGSCKEIKLLISYGADVNARNSFGDTPLHSTGDAARAQLLITNGANVNSRNLNGETPLHLLWGRAFCYDYTEFVEITNILFNSGADMSAIDFYGRTIFHHFAFSLESYPDDIKNTPWTKLDKQLPYWGIVSGTDSIGALYNSPDVSGFSPAEYVDIEKIRLIFPNMIKFSDYSSFPLGTMFWVAGLIYLNSIVLKINATGTLFGVIVLVVTSVSGLIFIDYLFRYFSRRKSINEIEEKANLLKQSK